MKISNIQRFVESFPTPSKEKKMSEVSWLIYQSNFSERNDSYILKMFPMQEEIIGVNGCERSEK